MPFLKTGSFAADSARPLLLCRLFLRNRKICLWCSSSSRSRAPFRIRRRIRSCCSAKRGLPPSARSSRPNTIVMCRASASQSVITIFVVGGLADLPVKLQIGPAGLDPVAAGDGILHSCYQRSESRLLFRMGPEGGERFSEGQALERDSGLSNAVYRHIIEFGHVRPAVGRDNQDALRFQHLHGFADGHTADAEMAGEILPHLAHAPSSAVGTKPPCQPVRQKSAVEGRTDSGPTFT